MSIRDPKPVSSDDSALPYLSTHRRFPHRTLRLTSNPPALTHLPRLSRVAIPHTQSPTNRMLKSPIRKDIGVEGNTTDEDSCPSSPLFLPSPTRGTSLMARKYFHPKYRSKW